MKPSDDCSDARDRHTNALLIHLPFIPVLVPKNSRLRVRGAFLNSRPGAHYLHPARRCHVRVLGYTSLGRSLNKHPRKGEGSGIL